MRHTALLLAGLLAACSSPAPAPAADRPPADAPAAAADVLKKPELIDRSETPLHPVNDTVGGIAFSLELPDDDLKRDARDAYINWTFAGGDPFKSPSITVKPVTMPVDLDTFVRSAIGGSLDVPPLVVATREQRDGGGMLVTVERSDGQYMAVFALVPAGDRALRCSVLQRTGNGGPGDRPIPRLTATRAWAEKICGSLTLE